GVLAKSAVQLLVAMRRNAELYARAPDRRCIRRFEIALAEMDEAGAAVDGLPPIIVDDKLAAKLPADPERAADFFGDRRGRHVLQAQLDQLYANARKPLHKGRIRNDWVKSGNHGSQLMVSRLPRRPGFSFSAEVRAMASESYDPDARFKLSPPEKEGQGSRRTFDNFERNA